MNRSVCTICSDFLTCESCVTFTCGHIFHCQCINTWKEQSSTCPQCRLRFKVPIKLYFELSREDMAEADPAELKNEITELKLKLRERDSSLETLIKEKKSIELASKATEREFKTNQRLLESSLGTNDALKKQLTYMERFKNEAKRLKSDITALQKKVELYQNIRELIDTESHAIETTLRNFSDNPDSFDQLTTSYVVLKKEFDRLKEAKRILENEKKSYRKKAVLSARETSEIREKLKIVTNDLEHLEERNKSLSQKVIKFEQSLASCGSKSSAMKRFSCESPELKDKKRQCTTDTVEDMTEESLILFDDEHCEDAINANNTEELEEKESIKIADEFGLQYVATTSVVAERKPLKDLTKKLNINSFASKHKHSNISNHDNRGDENSNLPHFKKGFNGMGGQSRSLVVPNRKTSSSFVKQCTIKKSVSGFNKIPKNNAKITKFITQRTVPNTVDLT